MFWVVVRSRLVLAFQVTVVVDTVKVVKAATAVLSAFINTRE